MGARTWIEGARKMLDDRKARIKINKMQRQLTTKLAQNIHQNMQKSKQGQNESQVRLIMFDFGKIDASM